VAYKTRLMEIGGNLFVEIPIEIQTQLRIDPKTRVEVKLYDRKSFLVEIGVGGGPQKEKCETCLQRPGKYTCQLCKKWVCSSCYWEMGAICRDCMGKK